MKTLRSLLVFVAAPLAFALPEGEIITNGSVSFERSEGALTVNQASGRAIVHYGSFNIGPGETVRFNQPGPSAAILNRVTGGGASTIAGALEANGQVYLVNRAGILFAPGATINVHGLVASALDLSDGNFLAGNLDFSGPGGSVVNQGAINAAFAYLVGSSVRNEGSITAGDVILAAGGSVQIGSAAGGEINLVIDGEAVGPGTGPAPGEGVDDPESEIGDEGSVVNQGSIDASGPEGGSVDIGAERIDQQGEIRADAEEGDAGSIDLFAKQEVLLPGSSVTTANANRLGDAGTIRIIAWDRAGLGNTGTLEARGGSEGGDGGFVELSGYRYVELNEIVDVSAPAGKNGTLFIDPADGELDTNPAAADSNIIVTPGNPAFVDPNNSTFTITPPTLNAQLANGDVIISTAFAGAPGPNDGRFTILDSSGANNTYFFQGNDSTLTILADESILVQTGIAPSITGEVVNFNLFAADSIQIDSGEDIVTGGGDFIASANNNINVGFFTTLTIDTADPFGGGVGGLQIFQGDVDRDGTGGVSFGATSTTGGGGWRATGVDIGFSGLVQTDQGSVSMETTNFLFLNGSIDTLGGTGPVGDVSLHAGGDLVFQPFTGNPSITVGGNSSVAFAADFPDRDGNGDIVTQAGGFGATFNVQTEDGSVFFRGQNITLGPEISVFNGTSLNPAGISVFAANDATIDASLETNGDLLVQAGGDLNLGDGRFLGPQTGNRTTAFDAGNDIRGNGPVIFGDRVGLQAGGAILDPIFVHATSILKVRAASGADLVTSDPGPVEGDIITPDLVPRLPHDSTFQGNFEVANFQILCDVPIVVEPPVNQPTLPPVVIPAGDPVQVVPAIPVDVQALEPLDPQTARFIQTVRKAGSSELPGQDNQIKQFGEFYFMFEFMQASEYVHDLDLNFVSYLLFGSARITADVDFPAETKSEMYFGGEKPSRIDSQGFGNQPR